jgi:hypothetical protein
MYLSKIQFDAILFRKLLFICPMLPMNIGVILPAAIIAKNEKMKKDFCARWVDPAREFVQKIRCRNSNMVAPVV